MTIDIFEPDRAVRVDTTFWAHRSIFAGTQDQLDELRREADARAAARAHAQAREWARAHARERERAWAWARVQAQARVDAEYRRAWQAATERVTLAAHHPVFKRLTPIMLLGLIPTLWAVATCRCGDRWPCNDAKLLVRRRIGWNVDPDKPLKDLTAELPKPATRWTRLRDRLTRRRRDERTAERHSCDSTLRC